MTQTSLTDALEQGLRHQQRGELPAAEAIYRQILQHVPDHPESLHLLGMIALQRHQHEDAIALIRRAIEARPDYAIAHNNLAEALRQLGRLPEAEASFRRAIDAAPTLVPSHHGLANSLQAQSRFDEAIAAYRQVVQLDPNHGDAWANLGMLLSASENSLDEAIVALRRAVALKPHFTGAWEKLGHALLHRGQREAAAEAFAKIMQLQPNDAGAWNNLAVVNFEIHGRLDESAMQCRKALSLDPNSSEAHNNLANTLLAQGYVEESIASFRRAIELRPTGGSAHSNLLLTLHYLPHYSPRQIYDETIAWAKRQAEAIYPSIKPHENDRSPDRRLRIGYVSQDYRHHPVATFLLPIFQSHDHAQFEMFCYSAVKEPDACTPMFKTCADHWIDITQLSDAAAAQRIRDDRIDILVDLSGHIGSNRLLIFAHKPAPVQVTYLGYPDTTGLTTMDYRLTDAKHDPPGQHEDLFTEKLIRLPNTAWCFQPWEHHDITPLPALSRGHVSFASLNNIPKITPQVIECWSRILQAVRDSTLLLVVHSDGEAPRLLREKFAAHGIPAERITTLPRRGHDQYMKLFLDVDLSLDTFPYNGHTTTCNSLWTGVPVVTIAGDTHVSRAGVSVLNSVGLGEFIGTSIDDYIQIAIRWATDLDVLSQARRQLRERMLKSALMDPATFTRNLESAYRTMWRNWCGAPA